MAENLNLNVKVDTSQADTSIGSLKKQLREAQQEVMALADKFGATSKEAVNAAKKAAELKDRIGDAKALTDAYNPDQKFKALTASLSGLAGGFGAVQGAMALFGAESEDVQKTLLKVQSAMAISQGLNAVGDSIDSFKTLGKQISQTTVFQKANNAATEAAAVVQKLFTGSVDKTSTGFKNLKVAMAATGIGLLIAGVTYLISNFEELSDAISGTTEIEKEHRKAQEEVTKATADFNVKLYSVQSALEAAKKGTISKKDALKEYNDKLGDTVGYAGSLEQAESLMAANTENVIKSIRLRAEAQALYSIAAEKAAKAIELQEQNIDVNSTVGSAVNEVRKQLETSSNNLKNRGDELTKQALELDSKKVKGLAEKPKEETDEEKARKAKAAADKARELRQQKLAEEEEERKKAIAKELQDELDAFEKRQALFKKFALTSVGKDGLTDAEREKKKQDDAKIKEAEEKRNQELIEESHRSGLGKLLDIQAAAIVAEQQQEKDNYEAKKRINELEVDAKQAQIETLKGFIGNLGAAFEQGTVASKTAAIAEIGINTALGYIQGLDIAQKGAKGTGPLAPFTMPIFYASQILAVIGAVGKAKQALSGVKGGGGVGGTIAPPSLNTASPMTPAIPTAQTTNISQQSINQLGNQAVKAYVIESDVTSNQQRIEAIRQRARFS